MVSVAVVFITLGVVFLLATPGAQASVLYWDNSGNGCWDTDSYWAIDTSGTSPGAWAPGDDANFYTASSGTVSISNSAAVGNIVFNAAGYVVSGGSLSVSGSITSNYNATIDSVLIGGGGLYTAGTGTLILGGNNTYSGTTTITAGTLQLGDGLTNTGSVPSAGITDNSMLTFAPLLRHGELHRPDQRQRQRDPKWPRHVHARQQQHLQRRHDACQWDAPFQRHLLHRPPGHRRPHDHRRHNDRKYVDHAPWLFGYQLERQLRHYRQLYLRYQRQRHHHARRQWLHVDGHRHCQLHPRGHHHGRRPCLRLHQGGHRHADAQRQRELYRRDDDQRRQP